MTGFDGPLKTNFVNVIHNVSDILTDHTGLEQGNGCETNKKENVQAMKTGGILVGLKEKNIFSCNRKDKYLLFIMY